jgi:2-dehydro-3-deoxy-D-arabinonate dehydratase
LTSLKHQQKLILSNQPTNPFGEKNKTNFMKIYKTALGILVNHEDIVFHVEYIDWDTLVNRDNLYEYLLTLKSKSVHFSEGILSPRIVRAPIVRQEIWAAGVTYMRSREARMEEAKDSGASDFYAKVYDAERPELFFKSAAHRCVGNGQAVNIRKDSKWNVPEPELTLFASSSGKIVGYTIGNDMSSRDIEGENPLYLPQAKSYDKSAAIGPCLYVPISPIDPDTAIEMTITRDKNEVFSGKISINQMKRTHTELIDYLFREMSFPHGVYLMTGTCLVPPNDFTLQVDDVISITIDCIGTLANVVKMK